MSKAHDPHWRYIAIRMTGTPVGRRAMQNAIIGRFRKSGWPDEELPQLTRHQWPHAILKFPHHRSHEGRTILPKMDWAIEGSERVTFKTETLRTSGTIKTLTDNLGILQERGKKEPAGKTAPRSPGRTAASKPTNHRHTRQKA